MTRAVVAMLGAAALAACAPSTPRVVDAASGWRVGTVLQVGESRSLGPPIDGDCRDPLEGTLRYAKVRYVVGRHAHLRIVAVPDDLPLAEGDRVHVNVATCLQALTR